MIECKSCNENVEEYVHYTLTAKDGSTIIICDSCYQDISKLEKINHKWVESVEENGTKYYNTTYWKELGIDWDIIES